MKTIGIIGGMGPLATVKLFEKIVLNTSVILTKLVVQNFQLL